MNSVYADVILPFALEKNYTYAVPDEFAQALQPGMRVEVPFRNKTYTGIIAKVHSEQPSGYTPKPILSLPDHLHVVNKMQLDLWEWMAEYYMCSIGDVMNAALPAPYKLSSETIIVLNAQGSFDAANLDDKEYLIAEALSIQKELTLKDIQLILQIKTIQPVIRSLIQKGIAFVKEEIKETYSPRLDKFIFLAPAYHDENKLRALFKELESQPKQLNILMIFYQLAARSGKIKKSLLLKKSGGTSAVLKTMVKHEIFEEREETVSRLEVFGKTFDPDYQLSVDQLAALEKIYLLFAEKNTVLLHGVTGSGKTEIYIQVIEKYISEGKQVLYLLPEIALTAQIITRLKRKFGNLIGVYHSKFSQNERVEIWQRVLSGENRIILGARSALFLPFQDLGCIVIDEEHDASYKQYDPNPRYHARDSAIYLAYLHGAKTLMGTATPAVETYYQALNGKFGKVELPARYADIALPEMQIIDVKEEEKNKTMQSHFSSELIRKMQSVLEKKEQVILFQNRRGYAPYLLCEACGWTPKCINCDVNMVYHKFSDELRCHYCNYKHVTYSVCPACASTRVIIKGFGTEKIEDELQYILPGARIGRMDLDAIKSKHGHEEVIRSFEEGEIDILVGTQMVTKGLDFDHVSLVGILSADQIINFSDYRATERAFQMMTQVSGRAGRKNKKGLVLIQALQTQHPVLQFVQAYDYPGFYKREILEREQFRYPPFVRLIRITCRYKTNETVQRSAAFLASQLKKALGSKVLGPAIPGITRIRNKYLSEILIKADNNRSDTMWVKKILKREIEKMQLDPLHRKVEFIIDVDPV